MKVAMGFNHQVELNLPYAAHSVDCHSLSMTKEALYGWMATWGVRRHFRRPKEQDSEAIEVEPDLLLTSLLLLHCLCLFLSAVPRPESPQPRPHGTLVVMNQQSLPHQAATLGGHSRTLGCA